MEFKCVNKDCVNNEVIIRIGSCTCRMVGDKLLADERFCLLCKQEMEEVKEGGAFKTVMVKEQFGSVNKNWSRQWGDKKSIY